MHSGSLQPAWIINLRFLLRDASMSLVQCVKVDCLMVFSFTSQDGSFAGMRLQRAAVSYCPENREMHIYCKDENVYI